ncbi:helix-turn-helix transcriptional regulator [Paraburkholderia sediminicola]|uniref:Helix-turn-helix transcriptional regulator n=1 Tax=Paraburkholderia metrosideri TaxID=580937 RepID=A0ABW9DNU9_9BURK
MRAEKVEQTWRLSPGSQYQRQSRAIIASCYDYRDGDRQAWHSHEQAQFVYTVRGVLRVVTPTGMWTLGPHRGLWIAPRIGHELWATGAVSMHSVYFEPEASPWPSAGCKVLAISPLLRELVAAMIEDKKVDPERRAALITPLLLKEMLDAPEATEGGLPLPQDRRLRQICESLLSEPANGDSLGTWGDRAGASERTLARLFRDETGLTFGQWRQQLRLVEAVSLLAQGTAVATIANQLGYTNSSAFITMFKRTMGETPQRYLR